MVPSTKTAEKINENGSQQDSQPVEEPKHRPDNLIPNSGLPKVVEQNQCSRAFL